MAGAPVIRRATAADADALAALAARTFPLACPASLPPEHVRAFIADNLGVEHFVEHIADDQWTVVVADGPDGLVGYALVRYGIHLEGPDDLRDQRSAYLSKIYVDPDHHGGPVAKALLETVLCDAAGHVVWLGVNSENLRARRFYAKNGFTSAGRRRFRVGSTECVDEVLSRDAARTPSTRRV